MQKLYTFQVTLIDSGLPYPNMEEAEKDAKEWANELAQTENCQVAQVLVTEDRY
jgi:hypothetical protein